MPGVGTAKCLPLGGICSEWTRGKTWTDEREEGRGQLAISARVVAEARSAQDRRPFNTSATFQTPFQSPPAPVHFGRLLSFSYQTRLFVLHDNGVCTHP